MHITSLPGKQGCGTLGEEARAFVDFLVSAGQSAWQILPTCPIGVGGSPYQSCSARAGSALLIDLRPLVQTGDLHEAALQSLAGGMPGRVDYRAVSQRKPELLRIAYTRSRSRLRDELMCFFAEQQAWLDDYTLFMALKERFGGCEWYRWEEGLKRREPRCLDEWRNELQDQIGYYVYEQYLFSKQWASLRAYANQRGIRIIGDLPIYVSEDSADVWANQEFFDLDADFRPRLVSGCPPDGFSADGQLWNNPLYRWDILQQHHYSWWIDRIRDGLRLYDMLRLDHFRGFDAYWAVPRGSENARGGSWLPGPGMDLFRAVCWQVGQIPAIAEDLGFLTDSVAKLREESGFPGMRVLQFAFDGNLDNPYLPHKYPENCVAYTGTHDNNTVQGWAAEQPPAVLSFAREYLGIGGDESFARGFLRAVWSSPAQLAIAPIQDFLELGNEGRMNTPSTVGENWEWRIQPDALTQELGTRILRMTQIYGRICEKNT